MLKHSYATLNFFDDISSRIDNFNSMNAPAMSLHGTPLVQDSKVTLGGLGDFTTDLTVGGRLTKPVFGCNKKYEFAVEQFEDWVEKFTKKVQLRLKGLKRINERVTACLCHLGLSHFSENNG